MGVVPALMVLFTRRFFIPLGARSFFGAFGVFLVFIMGLFPYFGDFGCQAFHL